MTEDPVVLNVVERPVNIEIVLPHGVPGIPQRWGQLHYGHIKWGELKDRKWGSLSV